MKVFYKIRGKKYLYLLVDIVIIVLSYITAFLIRFYPAEIEAHSHLLEIKYFVFLVTSFILPYYFLQIYRVMWAYSNIQDMYRLIFANAVGFLCFISLIFFPQMAFSRMHIILSTLILSIVIVFYRVVLRDYFSRASVEFTHVGDINHPDDELASTKNRILIIGAGEAGRTILSEYYKKGLGKQIIGFIDDDRSKIGKMLNGKLIIAVTKSANDIILRYDINEILIAISTVNSEQISRIVSLVKKENSEISIKILPSLVEIFNNKPLVPELRNIGIVDLIGREEFSVDVQQIEHSFSGKTVLVTGGGGSIGSEICKQLLKFKIKRLIAVGRGELSIYNLVKSFNEYIKFLDYQPDIVYRIADIKDFKLLNNIFSEFTPDVVFHAAAHKHVPLMEFNEIEAIQNNILGTKNILDLSVKYNVKEFVLISTDKAVHPVNIMGATKRIAEVMTLYYHREKELKTSIVRFGNVIGSSGSVIPLFREQIEKGGPVTVTHPDIKRYFMSIPEASLLVINAASFSNSGELFVLDMGEQYKITDIALNLIKLYGYEPGKDIKIEYTGLRPGEKLFEELYYSIENMRLTENEKIFVINSDNEHVDMSKIENFINVELTNLFKYTPIQLRELMKQVIPEFDFNNYESCNNMSYRMVN